MTDHIIVKYYWTTNYESLMKSFRDAREREMEFFQSLREIQISAGF